MEVPRTRFSYVLEPYYDLSKARAHRNYFLFLSAVFLLAGTVIWQSAQIYFGVQTSHLLQFSAFEPTATLILCGIFALACLGFAIAALVETLRTSVYEKELPDHDGSATEFKVPQVITVQAQSGHLQLLQYMPAPAANRPEGAAISSLTSV